MASARGPLMFRLILGLYPAGFRRRFRDEVLDLYADRRRVVAGARARTRLWLTTAADLVRSLPREHGRALRAGAPSWKAAGLAADARGIWRLARRSPGTTLAVVGLMAATTASATVVFGVVNAVLLRPLPFADPDRLVMIWERRPGRGIDRNVVGAHEFPEWRARATTFDGLTAYVYDATGAALTGAGEPLAPFGVRVTASFFDVLGVDLALGRGFRPEEDEPGRGGVAVISHRLWRERFGGDRDVVGREIRLAGVPTVIVGVAPGGFGFPAGPPGTSTDLWRPIAEPIHLYRGRHYLFVVGRLAPGASLERAGADLSSVARSLAVEFPELNDGHDVSLTPLADELVRTSRPALLVLFAGVAFLVLTGCANVAGLLAAQATTRQGEFRMRLALGASHGRLVRQVLLEGAALALAGGLAGLAAAVWLARAVPSLLPPELLSLPAVPIDGRVLMFATGLSMTTGLLFGLVPLAQLSTRRLGNAVRGAARSTVSPARLRWSLVVAEIALTVVLAVGAGLMLRSWQTLASVDPGFRPEGILTVDLALPAARYPEPHRIRAFHTALGDRIRALPGVTAVATTNLLPMGGGYSTAAVVAEGRARPAAGQEPSVSYRVVGAEYFRMLGMPITRGRAFDASDARRALPLIRWYPQQPAPAFADAPQAPPVAVVNEAMAGLIWPGEDPVGRQFRVLFGPPITVVGVSGDARGQTRRAPPAPEFYLSDLQEPQARTNVLVRAEQEPDGLLPLIVHELRQLDAELPVVSAEPLSSVTARDIELPRVISAIVALFAGTALALMAAGTYGLAAFTTAQRTREIGLRVALGAGRGRIRRMVLGQGLAMGLLGVGLGAAAAVPAAAMLRAQLFGVEPSDPLTFGAVTAVVFAALVAGLYGPARRAMRIDPATALRGD